MDYCSDANQFSGLVQVMAFVCGIASDSYTMSDCEDKCSSGEIALMMLLKRWGLLFSSAARISFRRICSIFDCSHIGQAVFITGSLA